MHEVIGVHDATLHRNANFASANFALKCNRYLHRNAHNAHMTAEQKERDRLRGALVAFFESARQSGAIRSVNQWAKAAGLSPSTINPVLNGTANKRLEDETYFKLSVGASKLLGRDVSADELKGSTEEKAPTLDELEERFIAALRRLPEKRRRAELKALEARLDAEGEEE